ncbi:hypothetical protein GYMLUDRAFT_240629 [Collybiopsis luxurians FD-317 M1]|nr:hypothetical protein GYMLUDRAFT_240629 [Collybiopsis luxurians FD-317 M1]
MNTRSRAKTAAIVNARTRGAKARARSGSTVPTQLEAVQEKMPSLKHKIRLVMDHVSISVPRNTTAVVDIELNNHDAEPGAGDAGASTTLDSPEVQVDGVDVVNLPRGNNAKFVNLAKHRKPRKQALPLMLGMRSMHTQEDSASHPPCSHSIPLPLPSITINDALPTGPPFPEAFLLHSRPATDESMTLGIETPSSNHSPRLLALVHDTDMFRESLASVEQPFTPDISLLQKSLTNDPFTEGSPHQWDVLVSPNSELRSPKTGKPGDGEYVVSHSLFGLMCGRRTSAWSRHPQQMNAVTVHFNEQYRLPPLTPSATVAQLNDREDLCIMVVDSLIGKYNAIWEGKMLPPTPPMVRRLAYKLQPASPLSPPSPMPRVASYPPSSPLVGPSRHPPFPEDRLGSSPVPDTSPSPPECQTSHRAASYPPSSPVAGPSRPPPFPGDSIGSSPVPDTSPSPPECQTSQREADKKLICGRDVRHLFDDDIDVVKDYSVGAHLGARGPLSPVSEVDEGEEEGSLAGVEVDEEEEEDSPAGVEEDEKLSKELPVVEEEEEYEEEEWNGIAPDEPVQQSVDSPPAERQLSSMKGKECAIETVSDDEGEDDVDTLNGEAASAEGEGENKAGALRKEWITEALQLKTDYRRHIKALAKRIGKSEAAVFSAIGEVVKEPRKMNVWNQFQHFMVVEDGMDWKQQPGQSREEFQASIQQAYKEVLDLPEKKKDYYNGWKATPKLVWSNYVANFRTA